MATGRESICRGLNMFSILQQQCVLVKRGVFIQTNLATYKGELYAVVGRNRFVALYSKDTCGIKGTSDPTVTYMYHEYPDNGYDKVTRRLIA